MILRRPGNHELRGVEGDGPDEEDREDDAAAYYGAERAGELGREGQKVVVEIFGSEKWGLRW